MERGLVRLFYGRPPEDQILVTFGVAIILVELVRGIYGGVSLSVPAPVWGQGIAHIGTLIYPLYSLQTLFISTGLFLVLDFVQLDRKRVVSGERLLVRVDLGGRCITLKIHKKDIL